MLQRLLLLLALGPVFAPAAADQDMVNERLPVSRAELEAHWRVNCGAAWAELAELAGSAPYCAATPQLRHALQLCAFIYQPPGEAITPACPDFAAALSILKAANPPGQCRSLANFLSGRGRCPPTVAAD